MNLVEINEKVNYVNPGLPTVKDKRYLVTLQFKIRKHLWWSQMKITADDPQSAADDLLLSPEILDEMDAVSDFR